MSTPGRKRLACDECTRKKVKCDKIVPCSNCIKRGLQDVCSRGGESDALAIATSVEDGTSTHPQLPETNDQAALIASLSARLTELENTIREIRDTPGQVEHTSARPTVPFQLPGASPASSLPPDANSASTVHDVEFTPSETIQGQNSVNNAMTADSEAASILEFLAWGRRKPDGHIAATAVREGNTQTIPDEINDHEHDQFLEGDVFGHGHGSQIAAVQLLLPSRQQIEQLVAYHEECILWYHGSFFPPEFRKQLDGFFDVHDGDVDSRGVNLLWLALLFAVLAGSMCCAPRCRVRSWGFRDEEKATLSRRWHRAVTICLNAGDFMSRHQLYSCEAIATLTVSSHLLGHSDSQSILLASAVRIAQSLGLHRLTDSARGPIAERGRRVWCQLCTQDWFGTPFSESYSINPFNSETKKPTNCHDHDLVALPDAVPTRVGYPRFLLDIARLMPQLQDGIASTNTLYTKYEQVLKYDRQMRALATKYRPIFLSNTPIEPAWPLWVPWARQSLTISSSHKIIMIHRQFLGLSFTNSLFSFTRRTCIAAAKTILKEQRQMDDPDTPHLWIHDAFSVAACIILCLDLFYRDPSDSECTEHRQIVEEALVILRNTEGSMIAQRGVRLVSLLLAEQRKAPRDHSGKSNKRKASETASTGRVTKQRRFDMDAFVKTFYGGTQEPTGLSPGPESTTSVETTPQTPAQQSDVRSTEKPSEVEESYTHRLLREAEDRGRPRTLTSDDMLSPRGNFENVSSFENLLFLAQTYNL